MVMSSEKPALLEFLEQKGIGLKDLMDAGLELFVPHPGLAWSNRVYSKTPLVPAM